MNENKQDSAFEELISDSIKVVYIPNIELLIKKVTSKCVYRQEYSKFLKLLFAFSHMLFMF